MFFLKAHTRSNSAQVGRKPQHSYRVVQAWNHVREQMLVELEDGRCHSCNGQRKVTGAADAPLDVEYVACGDGYTVEPDLSDGRSRFR